METPFQKQDTLFKRSYWNVEVQCHGEVGTAEPEASTKRQGSGGEQQTQSTLLAGSECRWLCPVVWERMFAGNHYRIRPDNPRTRSTAISFQHLLAGGRWWKLL